MIDYAYPYKEEVEKLYAENIGLPQNMFYVAGPYLNFSLEIAKDTCWKVQLVAIDENANPAEKLKGFMSVSTDRTEKIAYGLSVLSFDESYNMGNDIMMFIYRIFKGGARKIKWSVVVGSPLEKTYDNFIELFNGRIVGTRIDDCLLQDNNYHDRKLYELLLISIIDTEAYQNFEDKQ